MKINKKIHTSYVAPKTVNIVHVNTQTDSMIEYFCQSTITFGRNPACDIVLPSDLLIVSRLHAMINQYGDRYILKNLSPNGCYINGIKKEECILKEGDLIRFAHGGPVIGFTLSTASRFSNKAIEDREFYNQKKRNRSYCLQNDNSIEPPTLLTQASTDFTFQYGTTIKSFHLIKVLIGKGPCCDFVINHPEVDDKQMQIHYRDNKYMLLDLSETNTTLINDDNFIGDIQLKSGDIITLNVDSVQFEYLSEDRISEYNPVKYKDRSVFEDSHKGSSRHTPHDNIGHAQKH